MCICYLHLVTIIRHCRWNCPRIAHNVRLNLPTIKFCPSNSPKKTYLINSRDQRARRHDIRGPVYHPHVLHAQCSQRWAKVANVEQKWPTFFAKNCAEKEKIDGFSEKLTQDQKSTNVWTLFQLIMSIDCIVSVFISDLSFALTNWCGSTFPYTASTFTIMPRKLCINKPDAQPYPSIGHNDELRYQVAYWTQRCNQAW